MLNFSYTKSSINISGHALFAKYGKDIVCAAVSTAVIVSINIIDKLYLIDKIEYILEEAKFNLVLKELNNKSLNAIFQNLIETLIELSKDYPKYIMEVK